MWQKLIEFIRKIFNNNKKLSSTFLLSDEEVKRELEQQESNLKLLHEIIGSNPLDQIDWIIENGYDEYFDKYSSYQDGSIGKKKEAEFNVGDMVRVKESMNIGFIKGSLEDKLKDKRDSKDIVKYRSKYHGNLVFRGSSGTLYQWDEYGVEQEVLSEDVDELSSSRIGIYLEKVLDYDLKTFGETIRRRENENSTKEFKVTLEQAIEFHGSSDKGTPLTLLYQRVKEELEELEIRGIELDTGNEMMLLEDLKRATQYFNVCRTSLELNENMDSFKEELSEVEIVILAKYMIHSYIHTFLIREENLSQALNSKDYRMYSPANQLKTLQSLSEYIKSEIRALRENYHYSETIEVRGGLGNRNIYSMRVKYRYL